MVLRLRNSTRTGLLTKAEENGFYFKDEEGDTFIPEKGDVAVKHHARFVYVEKIGNKDAVLDEEGNVITPETMKSGWHADLILTCHHTADEFDFGDMVKVVLTPENEYGV